MKKLDKKELINSAAKSVFSLIPYAGTAITELVFEYNGRIKQNRLNKFVEILSESFLENSDLKLENIQTENFNDLFEAIIKRVFTTKSELKLKRFKDILIRELKTPTEQTEFIDIYLDLITNLSEEELIILFEHRHFDKTFAKEIARRDEVRDQLNTAIENRKRETIIIGQSKYTNQILVLENERKEIREKHEKLERFRKFENYGLSEEKYQFYIQRLYSQGLLIDSGIGRIGMEPFHMMSITEFGIEFINFIKKSC